MTADRTQEARERILNEAFEAPSPLAHLADRVSTLETALRDLRAIANREVLAEHGLRRRFIPDPEFHAIIDAALAEGDNRQLPVNKT